MKCKKHAFNFNPGWDLAHSEWDLAEWLDRLTANATVATVLGSISTSSDTVGAAGEAVWNKIHEKPKKSLQIVVLKWNRWSLKPPCVVKTKNAQIAFYWFSLFLAQYISDCSLHSVPLAVPSTVYLWVSLTQYTVHLNVPSTVQYISDCSSVYIWLFLAQFISDCY
jgi:hypothetical protein